MNLFWVNHPLVRWQGGYYVKARNFVDFADVLTSHMPSTRMVLPVSRRAPLSGESSLALRNVPLQVPGYERRFDALLQAWGNHSTLLRSIERWHSPLIMGHGPSALMALLALRAPSDTRFVFFLRGDTAATLEHMYHGRFLGRLPASLSRLFRQTMYRVMAERRAFIFSYGEALAEPYRRFAPPVELVAPLIDDQVRLSPAALPGASRDGAQPVPQAPQGEQNANVTPPLRILFLGRLSAEKAVSELMDAAIPFVQRGQISLTIAGEGPLQTQLAGKLSAAFRDEDARSRLALRGFVEATQVPALIDAHDLLILPSRTEGTPRVLAEAGARGKPVLATTVGGISGSFRQGLHALQGSEVHHIQAGLQWALEHRLALPGLGEAGWQQSVNFTFDYNARCVSEAIAAWK